ncbi:Hypothetical predicted protein, partial [Marmota monax]
MKLLLEYKVQKGTQPAQAQKLEEIADIFVPGATWKATSTVLPQLDFSCSEFKSKREINWSLWEPHWISQLKCHPRFRKSGQEDAEEFQSAGTKGRNKNWRLQ